MKQLYILRHGKSSWEQPLAADFDRPLLPKGEKRTRKIAAYLLEKGMIPGLIVSSPAKRAAQTARIVADLLNSRIVFDENLYHAHSAAIADIIAAQSDDTGSLMIVGHNPGLTSFANEYMQAEIDWLPTSGLAAATFDTGKWTDLPLAGIVNSFVITPKTI
jgi:phosphohistidine phosphatase